MHARKAGGFQETYIEWKFTDILISSYEASMSMDEDARATLSITNHGSSGVLPVDKITFNFSQIETEYKPQKSNGTLGPGIKTGYNIKKGANV